MKHTNPVAAKIAAQIEEINLAKEKALGFQKPVSKLEEVITSFTASSKLRDDQKLNAIIKKMEAIHKELTNHLDATYIWD
jgi:hypothetical protein